MASRPRNRKNKFRISERKRETEQERLWDMRRKRAEAKKTKKGIEVIEYSKKTKRASNAAKYLSTVFEKNTKIPRGVVEKIAEKYNTDVALLILELAKNNRGVEKE